jgi:hypothetical protein
MRIRENPLPIPPDRAPYFRVSVAGQTLHFRTPSLVELAKLGGVMGREQLKSVWLVAGAVQGGSSLVDALLAARAGAGDAFGLVGAVVGVAWADPALELETVRPAEWTPETLASFGAAVFEELHESGWKLGQVVAAALAVAEQVSELATFEGEVQERIRFFLRPKAGNPVGSPKPSATSSVDGSGPSAEAS